MTSEQVAPLKPSSKRLATAAAERSAPRKPVCRNRNRQQGRDFPATRTAERVNGSSSGPIWVAGPRQLNMTTLTRPENNFIRRAALIFLIARAFQTRNVTTGTRSEEHTSELQSLRHLVCR